MSPETKAKAKAKLTTLSVGVGYPDTWRDYSALQIGQGDAYGNCSGRAFDYRRHSPSWASRSIAASGG